MIVKNITSHPIKVEGRTIMPYKSKSIPDTNIKKYNGLIDITQKKQVKTIAINRQSTTINKQPANISSKRIKTSVARDNTDNSEIIKLLKDILQTLNDKPIITQSVEKQCVTNQDIIHEEKVNDIKQENQISLSDDDLLNNLLLNSMR